ncbi:MAG: ABC transporter permease [Ignavibacteria bacterium]|jgi:Uncharacterized ABC-type transport system, permease component|nr:MAG: ABC transporter permease [Chlorobiota bacterium]KXK04662.1 MAG: L-arabinose transporter permease protein [Chlorobi bacterium OLB4]MBV6399475.1 hypothetical protein [Ignavibacteria bacterium]MCC6886681.1 ABC transporter permease [Ignavibacteriales bacterium]MCE7953180.1 ABC transporter permease [Chlorobi bacterium CHB7]OQY76572.1 MAG: hypothetical protein B6D43_10360 [Ignavibacteriales bacterium UTCHB1]RIK50051.1 MAG: ABC transporter permease [Ignavibacteriota bacterium]
MENLLSIFSVVFLSQVFRMFTPYFFGAIGGAYSERGGVINIAIEGFLISSAFSFAVVNIFTGSIILSFIIAMLVNAVLSILFAIFTVKLKTDHIVTGVGFNLLIAGLADFLIAYFFKTSSNTPRFEEIPTIEVLSFLPFLSDPLIIVAFATVPLSAFVFFKTRFGLRLRSVGENPQAAESLGVKVRFYKIAGVVLCGIITSFGGIWLASYQNTYSQGMTAGRGYIALAAMIIGKWKPVNIFFVCLMFAFFEALEIKLQIIGSFIPSQFIQSLPYIVTILVLIGFIGKTRPPAADGVPY